nr:Fic family protein [Nitrosomonas nitrosa]
MFIWQQRDWPKFRWDAQTLLTPLAEARHRQGQLLGVMRRLGFDLKREAELHAATEEAIKTSAIEGEIFDLASVRSSVARRLGLPDGGLAPADSKVEGTVEMTLDATRNYNAPLTAKRLFGWHAALFPTGYSGMHRIRVGGWRTDAAGPMQVVSGAIGRAKVHYEAPPATRLPGEMKQFLAWFAESSDLESLLRAGTAHLWFVTIHPFDDGNGRIARAIADLALAQMEATGQRFYSMSSQIQRERKTYYDILEGTQRGSLDITSWLMWFTHCFTRAIEHAEKESQEVFRKAEFWQRFAKESLSERQKTVINRFLSGFEGVLTAKKWAALAKCSVDTAQRDINDLVSRGLLVRNPGGSKRTSYSIPGVRTGSAIAAAAD